MASPRRLSDEERAPFLEAQEINYTHPPNDDGSSDHGQSIETPDGDWTLNKSKRRLYVSHFLSTCNSRVFEFGSVLYLATIFPGTLLPMSVYALARGASAILFSSLVGQYIDRGNRLKVVRTSIGINSSLPGHLVFSLLTLAVSQRLAVAVSCVIFYLLAKAQHAPQGMRTGLLVLLILMACIEKLAAIMNLVSVEKDWVIVVANNDTLELRGLFSQQLVVRDSPSSLPQQQ